MANFPTSPTNGQTVTVNGILYTYNTAKGAWKRAVSSINNLEVSGNITAAGNISAGNVSVTNKVAAGSIYTTSGLFWAGNGVAFSSFPTALDANVGTLYLGNISTQANLGAFQVYSNANAASQQVQINSLATGANANTAAYLPLYTGNIGAGNIITTGTSGNISGVSYIFATNYVYPNGVSILSGITGGSGTYSNVNVEAYLGANLTTYYVYANANAATQATSINTINANLGAFQIFSNTNAATQATSINTINANLGAYQIYANANIGTLFLGNASTQANLGAFQIYSNSNAATQATSINTINANLGAYQTWANTNFGTSTYSNTNVTAFLTLGANIGSGSTTANLVAAATTPSTNTTTGALVVRGGAGVAGNVTADKVYTANGIYWSGNGAAYSGSYTASASAPANPAVGSFWYKTTTDVLYEYINDGTTSYWVDIQSSPTVANIVTSTYIGEVYGGNISFSGSITGSVGYLLERANVVASAPPAVTNLDLLTAPIMYFSSNTTQNITANIRGNSTVTLNSMLAVGQSSTFVIFIPNATGYYVNTVKVDNTTVNPYWQGGSTVVGGNANSIDIYTFAVLKTANATFKVFASQVRYQNLGP